jgi:tripartite-type tricarboxylate transporter receptor subunit TctC
MARAQATFPFSPIRMIVPFGAGGAPDITARMLAPQLSERLGQSVVVENRAGANGMIGAQAVANSRPDGHTLLAVSSSFVINPAMTRRMPFDPRRDFAPVAMIVITPGLMMVVNASSPFTTLAQLIEAAKRETLFYGSPGIGNANHLVTALMTRAARVEAEHVPYRSAGEVATALLGGQVHFMVTTPASVLPMIQQGQLRPLAFSGDKPFSVLPTVPLISDTLPGFRAPSSWHGLFAPAATPAPVVEKLNLETRRALRAPQVRDALVREGFEIPQLPQAEFREFVLRELEEWRAAVEAAKIEPQ